MTDYRTHCCNAPFGVGGKGTTHWYLCTACGQPTHDLEGDPMTEEESDALLLCSEHGVGIGDSDVLPNTSLIERVAVAIHPDPNLYMYEAGLAISEVAAWLRERGGWNQVTVAGVLERELERK